MKDHLDTITSTDSHIEDTFYGNTYGSIFLSELEERWKEIDLLIEEVKAPKEEDHVNVLCRSAVVLLVAHLEGFIKEAASVVIKDINHHLDFSDIPKSIQKTFVALFLDSEKIDNNKQKRLLEEFRKLNAKLVVDPFLFEQNKNPSPTIIEKILFNFGVTDFFSLINKSRLDIVFENNHTETEELLKELRKFAHQALVEYPYSIDLDIFDISIKSEKMKRKDSLWITFLDELLRLRHSIAHGSTFSNEITVNDLIDYKKKVLILQYGIVLVLFDSTVN